MAIHSVICARIRFEFPIGHKVPDLSHIEHIASIYNSHYKMESTTKTNGQIRIVKSRGITIHNKKDDKYESSLYKSIKCDFVLCSSPSICPSTLRVHISPAAAHGKSLHRSKKSLFNLKPIIPSEQF